MSREVDFSGPLSDEDKQYLLDRGQEQLIARHEAQFVEGSEPDLNLPAGVQPLLPQPASPDSTVPQAAGAVLDPTAEAQAAAEAFNQSQADEAGDNEDESEAPAPSKKTKKS